MRHYGAVDPNHSAHDMMALSLGPFLAIHTTSSGGCETVIVGSLAIRKHGGMEADCAVTFKFGRYEGLASSFKPETLYVGPLVKVGCGFSSHGSAESHGRESMIQGKRGNIAFPHDKYCFVLANVMKS